MTSDGIELYGFWRSAASFRVRIALSLKGLAWTEHAVDLVSGEQNAASFAGLNAQGTVPVLVDHGRALTQSLAIVEYLDESYPRPPLLPADPAERARIRAFALIAAADAHPLQVPRVRRLLAAKFSADDKTIAEWCGHWQLLALQAMEMQLPQRTQNAGFSFGETPSLADIALVPQVFTAEALGISLADFPRVAAVFRRCMTLDAFSRNSPHALRPASAG